jgi:hypothetical protein
MAMPALRIRLFALVFCVASISRLHGQLYWNTNGSTATWTAANWGTSASGPFLTGYTANTAVVFSADSTLTFATIAIGNVTVNDGVTVTVTQAGTMTSTNQIRTFDIGGGGLLTWTSQSLSANSTAGFIKNGEGTWNLGALTYTTAMTGGFTLNAGTVIVSGAKALGSGALNINGGTIQSSSTLTFLSASVNIGGNFIFTGTGNNTFGAPSTWAEAPAPSPIQSPQAAAPSAVWFRTAVWF